MALPENQQVKLAIEKAQQILISFPREHTIDAVASAMALSLFLKKIGKPFDVVCDRFELPAQLSFLNSAKTIRGGFENLQKFVITVDLSRAKLKEMSYTTEADKLNIYLTPKDGRFNAQDVRSGETDFKYDLIFCFDAPDLNSLGALHEQSPDFFYNTTIINVDHKASNEQFGQINITNPNAVATSELTYHLLKYLDAKLIDDEIATALLTGMISKTKSFKTVNVTPAALEVAGELLETGANQESVIKALYRSRSLATLNLWGRVLARLKSENGNKFVWSLISENDFVESSASEKDLPDVVDELISFMPGVEVALILFQQAGKIGGLLHALKNHNALYISKAFRSTGSRELARFELEQPTLVEAEQTVVAEIRRQLGRSG